MTSASNLKAIDLFCGCGGISVGLQQEEFNVLAGIDIEKKYLASFKQNFLNAMALNIDITKSSPEELMQTVNISAGWRVLIVWECSLKKDEIDKTIQFVDRWIKTKKHVDF